MTLFPPRAVKRRLGFGFGKESPDSHEAGGVMPTILALLAHAFLSVLAAAQPAATTHMMTC